MTEQVNGVPLSRYFDGREYTVRLPKEQRAKFRQSLYYLARRRAGVKIVTRSFPDGRMTIQALQT